MDGKYTQANRGGLVNLVQEEMDAEASEGLQPKKRKEKSARIRWATTIITWLLFNLMWTYAIDAPTEVEVMTHNGKLQDDYEHNIPNIIFLNKDVPLVVECDFKVKEGEEKYLIEFWVEDSKAKRTLLWEGDTSEECPDLELSLAPGRYHFLTEYRTASGSVSIGGPTPITGEITMNMYLWKPLTTQGYIFLNVLGLILVITDGVIRRWLKQRRAERERFLPLHKQRQKEDWEQVVGTMSGGDAVDVEDLMIHQQSADESMEMQRKRMREQFSAQEQVASADDGDTEELIDDVLADDLEELGEGTTKGFEGELQRDENIRTVGDLWKQLSDDDEKKR